MLQIRRDPAGASRRHAHRAAQQQAFGLWVQLHGPPRPRLMPARMHAVPPVTFQPRALAIEQGPGDRGLPAGLADIAHVLRPSDDMQPQSVYLLLEGHRSVLPSGSPATGWFTLGTMGHMTLVVSGHMCQRFPLLRIQSFPRPYPFWKEPST